MGVAISSVSGQYVSEQSTVERLAIPDDRILSLAGYIILSDASAVLAQAISHLGVNEAAEGVRISQEYEWPNDVIDIDWTGAEPGNNATSVSAFNFRTKVLPGGQRITELHARVTRAVFGLAEVNFIGVLKRRQSLLEGEVKVSGTPDDALRINTLPWLNWGHVDHDTKSQARYLGIVQGPVIMARLVIPLWSEGQNVPLSPDVRPGWPARFHAGTVDLTMSPVLSIRHVGAVGRVPVAVVTGIATSLSAVTGGGTSFYDVDIDITDEDLPDPGQEPGEAPGRVDQPIVTVDDQGVVSVNWIQPTGTEPFVYDINRAVAGIDPSPPTIGIGNDVTGTLVQDTPGEGVWRYRVRAINSVGVGEWSIWNGVQVGALGDAPGQVALPTVTAVGQLVTIDWDETTGTPPLRYQVVRAMGGISQTPPTVTVDSDILVTEITDTPGVGTWRYQVRAINDYGIGDWSQWSGVHIAEPMPSNSFNPHSDNTALLGIWSNGETVWLTDDTANKIFAYNLTTKQRDPNQDFDTLNTAGNRRPHSLWSDGTTMWVLDSSEAKVYAYNLDTKQRDESKDFNTLIAAGNVVPRGIWSNGITMWIADSRRGQW